MFEASSLLLLTLVLNVQLCIAAPIPVKVVQTSDAKPDPEELAPGTEDHSHFLEKKESAQEELIPVVTREAARSPEESPAEGDIPVTEKGPELVFIRDEVSADTDEAVSQQSAPQELSAAAPQESSEEESVPVEAAFLETSPGEVALAVAIDSQFPGKHYEEPDAPEALIPVILLEASEDEDPEENVEETAPTSTEEEEKPLPLTPEEEKPDVLILAELETVEAGQGAPDGRETAPQESTPENPVVIVLLDPAEQELHQEEQEETVPLILSEKEEAPEEHPKKEEAPIAPEETANEDPTSNEEPLPSTPEEEELVVLVHAELDGLLEEGAGETNPQKPAVIVLVGPTSEEPALDYPIVIIPLEDLNEYAAEDATEEEEVVQPDPLTQVTAPQENEAGDRDAEIFVTSVTEMPSETEITEKVLNPGEDVPVAATEVHVATLEPVTAPAPAVTDEQADTDPAPVEIGGGTMKTHSEDSKAALILTEEEPAALVKRGAVLVAVFFILISFIIIGIVWMTVTKKLH